ncbi:MAG: GH3 auxin-responsive promoter family protein [Candidatus Sericytochromatia bacterium]
MLHQLDRFVANGLLLASQAGAARRFRSLLAQPRRAQEAALTRILEANRGACYGRTHGFPHLKTVADFQSHVPIVDYDDLQPWIERIWQGEQNVLTEAPVLMLEKTSGSTAPAKYIPYTEPLRAEFGAATAAWLFDMVARRPALWGASAYWSMSPAGRDRETTPGGAPIGFSDDTEYFGPLARWVLSRTLRVPGLVSRIASLDANRYVTLRLLLDQDDLGLISVWNPSFLTLLMGQLEAVGDRLVKDLAAGTLTAPLPPALHALLSRGLRPQPQRARWLRALLARSTPALGTDFFPHLRLISCWTDAGAARTLPALEALFPGVELQGKGLLATEGVVTFPLTGHPGGVLALDSHFYEFLPEDGLVPRLADELELGRAYEVVITTGGGLYRYNMHDLVRVVGFHQATPLLEFIGKADKTSDMVGEKLNERHVAEVLARSLGALGLPPRFAMLAPEWGAPPRYALLLEAPELDLPGLHRLVASVEAGLRENPHYAYARDLGQLGPLLGLHTPPGADAIYLEACTELGQRAGDVKATALHLSPGWASRLAAEDQAG